MTVHDLPAVNASLNGLSAFFLTVGYIFIRRKHQTAHRNCMVAAFCTSIVFLICYLTYHTWLAVVLHRGPTRFLEPQWFRPIYLVILLTHTLLAMVIVPLILVTLYRARRKNFAAHKKIARWTWPLWMYVSVTGVVVYLLLYRIFPQRQVGAQAPAASRQWENLLTTAEPRNIFICGRALPWHTPAMKPSSNRTNRTGLS